MRTATATLAQPETHIGFSHSRIDDFVRGLVRVVEEMTEISGTANENADSNEEILVDTEIDGCRYLLVRLPRPLRARIQLSPREEEIVRMVAKGHPNKVIADVLSISSWTVCTHLRRIFAKLGVGSRAAMVAQLIEGGIINSEHRGMPQAGLSRRPSQSSCSG